MKAWGIMQPNGKMARQVWFMNPRQRDPVQIGSCVFTVKDMTLLGYKFVRVEINPI